LFWLYRGRGIQLRRRLDLLKKTGALRRRCLGAICFFGLSAVLPVGHTATVWIDTDVTVKSPFREADDAFALAATAGSSELRVAGISTSYGNGPLPLVNASARELISHLRGGNGFAVSRIYPGASSHDAIAERSPATEALAAALERERLTYIALGPLTNLAAFLKFHPERAHSVERIIFVGGHRSSGETAVGAIRVHDANVVKDPSAAQIVLRSDIPIACIPIDLASHLMIDRPEMEDFGSSGSAGSYIQSKTAFWFWFWTAHGKTQGAPVFDALAIIAAAEPRLLTLGKRRVSIDCDAGLTIAHKQIRDDPMVSWCTKYAEGRVERSLLRRLRNSSP
jgi:inosine-uridine nucleoside N-ribohydrolase